MVFLAIIYDQPIQMLNAFAGFASTVASTTREYQVAAGNSQLVKALIVASGANLHLNTSISVRET